MRATRPRWLGRQRPRLRTCNKQVDKRQSLTPEQLPAATTTSHLTFVDAAPGSGKTFLAVERFGWLRYYHIRRDPRGIAAVSFARSASAELRRRITTRWGPTAVQWPNFINTFDELHRKVLRFLLASGCVRWPDGHISLELQETWRRFPNTKQQGKDHKPLRASLDRDGVVTIVPLGSWPKPRAYFIDAQAYWEQLAKGVCTHDEVRSVLAATILDARPDLSAEIGAFLRTTFAHLLVDEVFDLNALDTALLVLAMEAGVQITLIGDPWQGIFEWRGSKPKLVKGLVRRPGFQRFQVHGSRRYRTDEMRRLSLQLTRGEYFRVQHAEHDRRPDVVLADRWASLWGKDDLPILAAGLGRLDRTNASAALTLLLNDFTMELFGIFAADIGNAIAALNWLRDRRDLGPARERVADPSSGPESVWAALYEGLGRPRGWGAPKATAGNRLSTLMSRVRSREPLILGTSTHQAKGLEWPNVDYVTDLYAGIRHRLDQDNANDRRKYVALTRAQDSVRVRALPEEVRTQMKFERLT